MGYELKGTTMEPFNPEKNKLTETKTPQGALQLKVTIREQSKHPEHTEQASERKPNDTLYHLIV